MKFLVLAFCVCAANAATFSGLQSYGRTQDARRVPTSYVPESLLITPEVTNTAYAAAQAVVNTPVVAAKAIYDAGKAVYNTGKTVYNGNSEADATIVKSDSEVSPDGFKYLYETENGIGAQASGSLKKVDNAEVLVIQGSYKYVTPDGTTALFNYVADENGYQPQSDLLPVGPAIPEYILRSLEYIRTHPQKVEQY